MAERAARRKPYPVKLGVGWPGDIRWSRGQWAAVQPFSPGCVYVNFLGVGDDGEDRVKAAYGPNYARLAQVKAAYDPTNLFRLNHNITATD
jgi:FAD/FMN-containing dehydrogenase